MRLWRRNVPADPAADHRQQDAEAAAAELQQPDAPAAEADDVAPPPPGETTSQSAAAEPAARRSWWQPSLAPPPAAAPEPTPINPLEWRGAEPQTEGTAELRQPRSEPEPTDVEISALRQQAPEEPAPEPPEEREAAASQGSEPWSWLRRRTVLEAPPPAPAQEPRPAADDGAELQQPDAEIEQIPAPPSEPATGEIEPSPSEPETAEAAERRGWFRRLRAGLSRSSSRLNEGINAIFNRRRLDDAALEELEELLISSDMGIGVAGEVTELLRRTRFNQEVAPEEVRAALAEQVDPAGRAGDPAIADRPR